jgi:hypothetical protein
MAVVSVFPPEVGSVEDVIISLLSDVALDILESELVDCVSLIAEEATSGGVVEMDVAALVLSKPLTLVNPP